MQSLDVKRTILLVDDEVAIVEVLSGILADEGFRVIVANNGAEGLRALDADSVDVVLLDLMMPVMDGREMLRELRARPAHVHRPVVLMSAAAPSEGGDADPLTRFLRKPFDIEDLLGAIAQVVAVAASLS